MATWARAARVRARPRLSAYWLAWLASITFFAGFYALLVPLPRYLARVGLQDWQIGFVLGVFGIASLVGRPLSGVVVDRFGGRVVMLAGTGSLAVGALGVAATSAFGGLLALRVLQAVGYVAFTTASTALVVSLVAPGVRAGRLATFGAAANIAIALAPAAITLLLVFAPLEAGLVAPAVFACVAGMLVARLPPTPSQDGSLARQAPASARDAAGAGLQRGVEQSGSTELLSRAVSQGASETGPTLASELGTSGERLLLMLAPPRRVWWPMLVTGLLGAGFAAFFQFGPILADRSAISPGLLYTVYGVAIIGTRLASGRLLNRLEVVQVVIPAALLMTFAYALIATNQTLAPVALGVALVAVSGGLFHPALLAHHAALLPDAPGRASAAFYVAFDLGIGLGSWAFGVVLNLGGLGWLYSAAAMFAAGAAGVSVWSRLARPLAPREAAPVE